MYDCTCLLNKINDRVRTKNMDLLR